VSGVRFPTKAGPDSGTSLTCHMHKRRKPQPSLGFSVEAPGLEDGAGIRPNAIVH
jgi:hypothetical protein